MTTGCPAAGSAVWPCRVTRRDCIASHLPRFIIWARGGKQSRIWRAVGGRKWDSQANARPCAAPGFLRWSGGYGFPRRRRTVCFQQNAHLLRAMVTEAASLAPTLLISPPPVADPDLRGRIANLNEAEAELCAGVECAVCKHPRGARRFPRLYGDLSDGLPPGSEGCGIMAEADSAKIVQDFLRADMNQEVA